jgi:hypothetical protein
MSKIKNLYRASMDNFDKYEPTLTRLQPDGSTITYQDVVVSEFSVYTGTTEEDVEAIILNWQESAIGKWAKSKSAKPIYIMNAMDFETNSYRFKIIARLSDPDLTYFNLKFK